MRKILSKIWNVIKIICVLICAFAALIAIIAFFSKPNAKIIATIEYSSFSWPPTLDEDITSMKQNLADPNKILAFMTFYLAKEEDRQKIANKFSEYLDSCFSENAVGKLARGCKTIYRISMHNAGKQKCTGISVSIPYAQIVKVYKEGENTTPYKDIQLIKVEALQPDENVYIEAWSAIGSPKLFAKEIKIRHDSGVAKIRINMPVGRFAQWIDKNIFFILMATPIIVWIIWIVTVYFCYYNSRKSSQSHDNSSEKDNKK
jgi:hypothetical protein